MLTLFLAETIVLGSSFLWILLVIVLILLAIYLFKRI